MTIDRIEPSWTASSTQHRCVRGGWQPGRTKDCADCPKPGVTVKRSGES